MFDTDYLDVEYIWHTKKRSSVGGTITEQSARSLGTRQCGTEYAMLTQEVAERLSLNMFYCPASKDYALGGNFASTEYNYLEILVKKCQGKATCKTSAQIDTAMKGMEVTAAISNYFFDVEKYKDPLDVTFEMEFQYPMISGFTVEKHLKVRVNEAVDYTSLFMGLSPKEYTYYSIEKVLDKLQVETSGQEVMRLYIELDYSYTSIERKVYTFYDVLGDVGGIMGVAIPLGALFANFFSGNIYMMTLLTYFYKVPSENHSQNIKGDKAMSDSKAQMKVVPERFDISMNQNQKMEEFKGDISHVSIVKPSQIYPENEDMLHKVKKKISSLEWYPFKWRNVFYSLLCCPKMSCKKKPTPLSASYDDFDKGSEKLTKELDLINFVDSMRKTNLLCELILDRQQQFLMSHQPINVTTSDMNSNIGYPKEPEKPPTSSEEIDKLDLICELEKFSKDSKMTQCLINGVLLGQLEQRKNASPCISSNHSQVRSDTRNKILCTHTDHFVDDL